MPADASGERANDAPADAVRDVTFDAPADASDDVASDAATDDTDAGDVADARDVTDASDTSVDVNPCTGIPSRGRCLGPARREACATGSEGVAPTREESACPSGTTCQDTAAGAACVSTAACIEGATGCAGTSLRTCTAGRWVTSGCPGDCVDTGLTGFCRPTVPSRVVSGHVLYAGRRPDVARMNWGPVANFYGQDFEVVSGYGSPPRYLDAVRTTTGSVDPGAFSLRVRATPDATDFVAVIAASYDARGYAYLVADPRVAPGAWPTTADTPDGPRRPAVPDDPRLYQWVWPVATLPATGELVVTEAMGSGAAFVFDVLGIAARTMAARFPGVPARTLVAWLGPEVDSSCGGVQCYSEAGARAFFQDFQAQLWIPGTAQNQEYYSVSTLDHEVGHWVMSSFSVQPREGGPHAFGTRSSPGLAWAEGFAHWFSSDVRGDATHFDRQLVRGPGTPSVVTVWKDIAARMYRVDGRSGAAAPAEPAEGILQPLDEDDIAADLWTISRAATGSAPFYRALASPRMTTPALFYGYRSTSTGEVVPVFPDFLDALGCEGVRAADLRAALDPDNFYPYPDAARSPRCGPSAEAGAPLVATFVDATESAQGFAVTARVEARGVLPGPVTIAVEGAPVGAFPSQPVVLPPGASVSRVLRFAVRPAALSLTADARGPGARVRAESALTR
ncbi:MAG: hypothetical protein U0324_03930 [Polyangiales bacterium]